MGHNNYSFLVRILIINLLPLILVACTVSVPTDTPSGERLPVDSTIVATRVLTTSTSLSVTVLASIIPTSTSTVVSTVLSATQTVTPTPQPTMETVVAIPTPPGERGTQQVLWLFENNNGCQLPCWWGITPGKTSWQTAQEFLNGFDSDIYETSSTSGGTYYGTQLFLPSTVFAAPSTELGILVQNDTVERIEAEVSIGDTPPGYLSSYILSAFLNTYGQPSEVWLSTYSAPFEQDDLPFIMALFYPDKGIAALYSDNGVRQGDVVHGCPQEDPVSVLKLWSPDIDFTFEELVSSSSAFNREYLSLEESTEMDVAAFYETFKNPDNTTCLETPASLWR